MRTLILFLALTSTAFAHRTAQLAAEASARGSLCHRGCNPSYEDLAVRVRLKVLFGVAVMPVQQT